MNTTIDRLQSLHVADAMSQDVVTVSANSTMAEAAVVLSQHAISGVPVVNDLQQCVGILSTTDFARREQSEGSDNPLATPVGEYMLVRDNDTGPFQIEHVAENRVRQHMSPAPQTIKPDQPLVDAARYMLGEHIHRLVVLDESAHPVGVITSLDLIAALVNSVDEQTLEENLKTYCTSQNRFVAPTFPAAGYRQSGSGIGS